MFSKREAILLAAAAIAVAATVTVLFSRLTLDDAYITFRYARHLAEGYGPGAWNHTGEHVEGYSSLLWILLLAGLAARAPAMDRRNGNLRMLTLSAIAIHRWVAYHSLAPNTYFAKVAGGGVGHVKLGLAYVGGWMLAHAGVDRLSGDRCPCRQAPTIAVD